MKAITKGVMDVTEEGGAFVRHRVSEAQMAIYKPNTGGEMPRIRPGLGEFVT